MVKKQEKRKKRIFKKEDIPLYIMAAPTVVLLIMFNYLPMTGLLLAFKDYKVRDGIFGSAWCGFKNFKFLFASTDAFIITRNTVLYNITFIFVNLIVSVIMALMLNEIHSKRRAKIYQTIYMLPYFLSWAAVAMIVGAFLEYGTGYVGRVLQSLGYEGDFSGYMKIEIWPPLLVFLSAWKGVGYQTVMYLAVISGINTDYYEAAVLDGATRLQQARYITLPHLRTIITISIIMAMGGIFRGDFGLFFSVPRNSGVLYPVTNVIDTYIYRAMTSIANVGMPAAAGLFQSVVGFIFVLLANKIVTKIDPDNAMF